MLGFSGRDNREGKVNAMITRIGGIRNPVGTAVHKWKFLEC